MFIISQTRKLNIRNCFISKQVIKSLGSMVSQGFVFVQFQEESRWKSEVQWEYVEQGISQGILMQVRPYSFYLEERPPFRLKMET